MSSAAAPAVASSAISRLRAWLIVQLAIDVVAGAVCLLVPPSLLLQIPLPALPPDPLSIRLIGLYAAAMALAWGVAARDPARNQSSAWIGNAIRVLGTFTMFVGATLDPAAPSMLRGMAGGEFTFAIVTALLLRGAGLPWALPDGGRRSSA